MATSQKRFSWSNSTLHFEFWAFLLKAKLTPHSSCKSHDWKYDIHRTKMLDSEATSSLRFMRQTCLNMTKIRWSVLQSTLNYSVGCSVPLLSRTAGSILCIVKHRRINHYLSSNANPFGNTALLYGLIIWFLVRDVRKCPETFHLHYFSQNLSRLISAQ